MSRFYADIQGNRGPATRCGSAASGISGHIRGWGVGCRVIVQDVNGEDVVYVYKTGGSVGGKMDELIAEFGSDGRGG